METVILVYIWGSKKPITAPKMLQSVKTKTCYLIPAIKLMLQHAILLEQHPAIPEAAAGDKDQKMAK